MMKKLLLRTLLLIILLPVACIAWEYAKSVYYRDQFRFEHFDIGDESLIYKKTEAGLLAYLRAQYPEGSDPKKLINLLKGAGAACKKIERNYFTQKNLDKCKEITHCEYTSSWFAIPSLTTYEVQICEGYNGKIFTVLARAGYWGP